MPFHVAALRFVGIIAAALATGGLALLAIAIVPAMQRLPTVGSVRLHQEIHAQVHPYMPGTVASSGLFAIAVLVFRHDFGRTSTVLTAIGLAATLIVIVVSQFINTPINNAVASWSLDQIPNNYLSMRERWRVFNLVRTVIMLAALSCYVAAALSH
jgi:uncharacterized membrane protein